MTTGRSNLLSVSLVSSLFAASIGVTNCFAATVFYPTSSPPNWSVCLRSITNDGSEGPEISAEMFDLSNFVPATAIVSRTGWIARNDTGSGNRWALYVFRQQFDLTGYDPSSAVLSFKWAADDSGANMMARGQWIPAFRLNDNALHYFPTWNGSGYTTPGQSYVPASDTVATGFASGINTIDFYVEGNGTTDGFYLGDVSFSVNAVSAAPLPTALPAGMLLLGGLSILRAFRRPAAQSNR